MVFEYALHKVICRVSFVQFVFKLAQGTQLYEPHVVIAVPVRPGACADDETAVVTLDDASRPLSGGPSISLFPFNVSKGIELQ